MIQAILFDKDGTLFDFQSSWSVWAKNMLQDLSSGDPATSSAMAQAIGFDMDDAAFLPDSIVIAGTDQDLVDALLPFLPGFSETQLVTRIMDLAAEAEMAPTVPLIPFLAELRRLGMKLGVATNDSEQAARAHLEEHDILSRFDFVAGANSGHGAKPAPGMCLAFARHVSLSPEAVMMVGDSLHDLHAGKAAGMSTLGVLTGLATREELAPSATHILQDIGGLPGLLENLLQDTGSAD